MDFQKIESAVDFLSECFNSTTVMSLLNDRIPEEALVAMSKYAEIISKARDYDNDMLDMKDSNFITCILIMGYLLKSHIDRVELERICQK